jgi:hypothetical protein
MIAPSSKRQLFATTIALLITGCSSGSSSVCQETFSGFNCGDCLVPNNFSLFCHPLTLTSSQQSACQSACSSSADQAALSGYFTCINKLPAEAGTCSLGSEPVWLQSVALSFTNCLSTDAGTPSTGCQTGFLDTFFDGGG